MSGAVRAPFRTLLTIGAVLCAVGLGAGEGGPPQEPAAAATAPATAPPATSAAPAPVASPVSPAATATPQAPRPMRSPAPKKIRLGPYVDAYGRAPVERIFDVPHFETRVEVQGKAMDAAALTARMEWWMRDFEPLRGAVPRQGSAPSYEDTRDLRTHPADSLNLLPIFEWLAKKLK